MVILTFAHPALLWWALCCPGVSVTAYRTRRRINLVAEWLIGIVLGVVATTVLVLLGLWLLLR